MVVGGGAGACGAIIHCFGAAAHLGGNIFRCDAVVRLKLSL